MTTPSSPDGAHLGIDAERALHTIIGGEPQPTDDEQSTPDELRRRIMATPLDADEYDYGTASDAVARLILECWTKYPETQALGAEPVYERDDEANIVWRDTETDKVVDPATITSGGQFRLSPILPSIFDVLTQIHPEGTPERARLQGLTGFMVGWAVNAARYCIGAPPNPNPAILQL